MVSLSTLPRKTRQRSYRAPQALATLTNFRYTRSVKVKKPDHSLVTVARGQASRLRLKRLTRLGYTQKFWVAKGQASRLRLKRYPSSPNLQQKLGRQGAWISSEIEITQDNPDSGSIPRRQGACISSEIETTGEEP